MAFSCNDNCTTSMGTLYKLVADDMWIPWYSFTDYFEYQPWIFSMLGSAMVGLSGVFPLFIIPIDEGANLKSGAGAATLKMLLSFAVGGLLGDVFLHLLPEAWSNKSLNITSTRGHPSMVCGLWVLTGFLVFIIAEKMFIGENNDNDELKVDTIETETDELQGPQNNNQSKKHENNNSLVINGSKPPAKSNNIMRKNESDNFSKISMKKNGYIIASTPVENSLNNLHKNAEYLATRDMQKIESTGISKMNGFSKGSSGKNGIVKFEKTSEQCKITEEEKPKPKHITGYLNLLANCIDNFTHGLAVGGSFLISFRLGALTTFAILIHEIPHEVGDFAILLKSGFSRWDAARAQLMTASGGILGALIAVLFSGSGVESRTSWILPFTAGSFLHIGLVTVLPELLKESNPRESMKQLGALLSGISVMALLTILCD